MFNAEQMLGKMLAGTLGSGMGSGKQGLASSLASQLTSGAGLMTMIGLGVGAYEILKGQSTAQPGAPSIPLPPSENGGSIPPPLPPLSDQVGQSAPSAIQPPIPPTPAVATAGDQTTELDGQTLAFRMIQAMIAAAQADGNLDAEEEGRILERLQEQGLSREEKQILLQEMHQPKTIEQLADGISNPATAQMLYSIAALAITIDTAAERQWLDQFAQALKIRPTMQRFLEDLSA